MTTPLGYTVTHCYDGVDISDREFQHILDLASWKQMPRFSVRGRSAWHILREGVVLKSVPDRRFAAAKLKGVGVWNPEAGARNRDSLMVPMSDIPSPPTTIPLESFATYPHFGLTREGEYSIVFGKVAPVGGILHERAALEYDNAKRLTEAGVTSIVPMAVIEYDESYRFDGKPMGASISLSHGSAPYRLSELQYGAVTRLGQDPDKDAYCERVLRALDVDGELSCEITRLRAIRILSRQIGGLMHDFTAAGLYRYSPEWTNLEFDFDSAQAVLTDLDSTRPMAELDPHMRTLHALRDLASLLYRTLAKFSTPSALGHYSLANLLKYDPLAEVLQGYFPGADVGRVRTISSRLWNAGIPYLFLLTKYREQIRTDWDQARRRSYKMDHDLFYVLAISSVFELFQGSDIMAQYPSDLTRDALSEKARRYLGERFEYFLYLLEFGGSVSAYQQLQALGG